ncbi:hypothetical protein GCM10009799_33350 [Nocardiopsis rhodophaea]|uniref:Uncharacterized protein n=1 Tax=Nocardiopsis rhodophaea TaxID=280238 RepID=A0ABN2TAQ6_9ACTN
MAVALLFAVLLHMVCSAAHPAVAAADVSASAPQAPALSAVAAPAPAPDPSPAAALAASSAVSAQMADATGSGIAVLIGAHSVGEVHECTNAMDGGTDQRGSSPSTLSLLLAVGFAVLVGLWTPPVLGQSRRPHREQRPRRRNAARLLLTLCVWRV